MSLMKQNNDQIKQAVVTLHMTIFSSSKSIFVKYMAQNID